MIARNVGVAPGTTVLQLGDSPQYKKLIIENPFVAGSLQLGGLGIGIGRSRIRWGLLGYIGGGSLIIALTAGLIASAID